MSSYSGPGYVMDAIPGHHLADRRGRVYRHRRLAELKLGRKLRPGETIDHVNGDVTDNRPENLRVYPSQSEHVARHRSPSGRFTRARR